LLKYDYVIVKPAQTYFILEFSALSPEKIAQMTNVFRQASQGTINDPTLVEMLEGLSTDSSYSDAKEEKSHGSDDEYDEKEFESDEEGLEYEDDREDEVDNGWIRIKKMTRRPKNGTDYLTALDRSWVKVNKTNVEFYDDQSPPKKNIQPMLLPTKVYSWLDTDMTSRVKVEMILPSATTSNQIEVEVSKPDGKSAKVFYTSPPSFHSTHRLEKCFHRDPTSTETEAFKVAGAKQISNFTGMMVSCQTVEFPVPVNPCEFSNEIIVWKEKDGKPRGNHNEHTLYLVLEFHSIQKKPVASIKTRIFSSSSEDSINNNDGLSESAYEKD
jgi:hypothetical protein